jgi:hypothetical protein
MSLTRPTARVRRLAPAGATLLLALAVGACAASPGGQGVVSLQDPSASPDPSAVPSASIDPEDAMEAFEACMREHGVDVQVAAIGEEGEPVGGEVRIGEGPQGGAPAQPGGGTPPDREAVAEADEACRHLLPAGGMGDPDATMDPALADQMLEFAQCMRDNGIDFPDPVFEGGGVTMQIGGPDGGGIDPSSDSFQAAQEACAEVMPERAPFMTGGESAP